MIKQDDRVKRISGNNKTVELHQDCFGLFSELVREGLREKPTTIDVISASAIAALPLIKKRQITEYDAIVKVLEWASENHPLRGLTPKEVETLFKDQFRWKLTNVYSRLGELVDRGRIRRIREKRGYRYFA